MSTPTGNIVLEGDSLTAIGRWDQSMYDSLGWTSAPGLTTTLSAVSGSTTIGALARAAACDTLLATGPMRVYSLWIGTNDLGNTGLMAPQHTFDRFLRLCAERRSKGAKIIAASMISRNAAGDPSDMEANRQLLNTLLRNWQTTFCDQFVDLGNDSLLGAAGACDNTTYFQVDKTHLTATGYARVGSLMQSSFLALAQ